MKALLPTFGTTGWSDGEDREGRAYSIEWLGIYLEVVFARPLVRGVDCLVCGERKVVVQPIRVEHPEGGHVLSVMCSDCMKLAKGLGL